MATSLNMTGVRLSDGRWLYYDATTMSLDTNDKGEPVVTYLGATIVDRNPPSPADAKE